MFCIVNFICSLFHSNLYISFYLIFKNNNHGILINSCKTNYIFHIYKNITKMKIQNVCNSFLTMAYLRLLSKTDINLFNFKINIYQVKSLRLWITTYPKRNNENISL
ncbi:hypothetical protein EDEG_00846 [Edhazardia aedis USNM 41457]|uniref:Uncharacterized protein n=1 Tax=Edhazardia aedis (strain USNM 41457) TaxID=1003232 RepID=J9DR92_EDHAE|nr:hypothetical protein EDEG_00846 [Edhazardia aedis USNM 41457]|eukprot:EJW05065.1 hypothetical protein EDEG_00846 [Edhazardia aedis USNM 41457]